MPLAARLDRGVRAERIPARPGQVLQRRGVPAHRHERPARCRRRLRDPQSHRGVRRPRRRVAEAGRRAGRVRGIGDVPALHPGRVHPCGQQALTVRRPPVAPIASHLLGRNVFRQPEADVGPRPGVRPGHHPVCRAVGLNHPHGTPAGVGNAPPGGIRARIDHWLRCREPADRGIRGPDRPELPGEGEGQELAGVVGRIGHNPGRLLAGTLAPGSFLRRQLLRRARQQTDRVSQQTLLLRRAVESPQAGHRVIACPGPQEIGHAAVRCQRDVTRNAEGQAPGAGVLPGQRPQRCGGGSGRGRLWHDGHRRTLPRRAGSRSSIFRAEP